MYSKELIKKKPLPLNQIQHCYDLLFGDIKTIEKKEHLLLWHVPYFYFILAWWKDQEIGNDIAGLLETEREQALKVGK